tara:strand:+ start:3759 stop:4064 length:306 start_codon:yes stop_codon:yes gene_type:complete
MEKLRALAVFLRSVDCKLVPTNLREEAPSANRNSASQATKVNSKGSAGIEEIERQTSLLAGSNRLSIPYHYAYCTIKSSLLHMKIQIGALQEPFKIRIAAI